MFYFHQQQFAAIQRAQFRALLNLTDKYMDGFQKLAQLNVQTVRTVISESNDLAKPENGAGNGDSNEWQTTMLTQLPEKAASYTRHLRAIVSETEADLVREAQSQVEVYGSQMNEIFKAAVDKAAEASEKMTSALESNTKEVMQSGLELAKAGENLSKDAISRGVEMTEEVKTTSDAASQSFAKSGNKR